MAEITGSDSAPENSMITFRIYHRNNNGSHSSTLEAKDLFVIELTLFEERAENRWHFVYLGSRMEIAVRITEIPVIFSDLKNAVNSAIIPSTETAVNHNKSQ